MFCNSKLPLKTRQNLGHAQRMVNQKALKQPLIFANGYIVLKYSETCFPYETMDEYCNIPRTGDPDEPRYDDRFVLMMNPLKKRNVQKHLYRLEEIIKHLETLSQSEKSAPPKMTIPQKKSEPLKLGQQLQSQLSAFTSSLYGGSGDERNGAESVQGTGLSGLFGMPIPSLGQSASSAKELNNHATKQKSCLRKSARFPAFDSYEQAEGGKGQFSKKLERRITFLNQVIDAAARNIELKSPANEENSADLQSDMTTIAQCDPKLVEVQDVNNLATSKMPTKACAENEWQVVEAIAESYEASATDSDSETLEFNCEANNENAEKEWDMCA